MPLAVAVLPLPSLGKLREDDEQNIEFLREILCPFRDKLLVSDGIAATHLLEIIDRNDVHRLDSCIGQFHIFPHVIQRKPGLIDDVQILVEAVFDKTVGFGVFSDVLRHIVPPNLTDFRDEDFDDVFLRHLQAEEQHRLPQLHRPVQNPFKEVFGLTGVRRRAEDYDVFLLELRCLVDVRKADAKVFLVLQRLQRNVGICRGRNVLQLFLRRVLLD